MYVSIPKTEELHNRMKACCFDFEIESDKEASKKEQKANPFLKYFIDCDMIQSLNKVEEHEEWNIDFDKSIRISGLANMEEIKKLQYLESNYVLKIVNMKHTSLWHKHNEEGNPSDYLEDGKFFVTAYLSMDENERFFEENLFPILEEYEEDVENEEE